MADPIEFESNLIARAEGVHNYFADEFVFALTNVSPEEDTQSTLADITEIDYTGLSSRSIALTGQPVSEGVLSFNAEELTLTATGTNVGPFRYAVAYNTTVPGNPLISYYDYGAEVTITDGNSFVIDFATSFVEFS